MDAKVSFTPEVTKERIGISYSFKFPSAGVFQCSLTGLVFNVTHEGDVTYKILIWDTMELEQACKFPGGPLYRIKSPQDCISQLHLPHCEPEPALVSQSISVVHLTDDGMSILQPLEVTDTHVVVNTPQLAVFGIVWDIIKRFKNFSTKPVCAQILLFLRPVSRGGRHILHVILLPSNVPLQEVKDQRENDHIQAPAHCLLHMGLDYSLHSDPDGFKIQPATSDFCDNYGPNYHATFEIILVEDTEEVTLMVRDPEKKQVWKHHLHMSALHDSGDDDLPRTSADIPSDKKL